MRWRSLSPVLLLLAAVLLLAPSCAEDRDDFRPVQIVHRPLASEDAPYLFLAPGPIADELAVGHHPVQRCLDCHLDPNGTQQRFSCETCHSEQAAAVDHPIKICVACHMPAATYVSTIVQPYRADRRTHILKIHVEPVGRETMFESTDGQRAAKDGYGITLDYTCYGCHKDAEGNGGNASERSLGE
ncbi:MAG: hypothetical protein QUU85_00565, partial [Candidatus Eisenbacteria bacterium]|nr:hypothetical protein [Candidatus Eisenbacteria bacterium]